jgi:outer membrane protein OmpA-like peptidoglycan-associated protein
MRISIFAVAAATLMMGSGAAWAQGNPSADQIINALKPGAGMLGTTRGIRPAAPSAPAPASHAVPAAARTPAPMPQAAPAPAMHPAAAAAPMHSAPAAEAPSIDLNVQFQTGSAGLTPAAMKTLDQLGQALSSATLANYRFRIAGHTDTVGSPAYNKALSAERAASVAKYLEQKFGVKAARLETIGRGEEGLLVQTPDQTPEPRNRRVQIVNLGA